MAEYAPSKVPIPVTLDDIALRHSLIRFPDESLTEFRDRVLAEVRSPSDVTQISYISELGRQLGLKDTIVCSISLTLLDGEPIATDPYLEITSTKLRYYSDWDSGVPDIDINLLYRAETLSAVTDPVGSGVYDSTLSTDLVLQILQALVAEATLTVTMPREWDTLDLSIDNTIRDSWIQDVGARLALNFKFSNTDNARHLIRTAISSQQVLPHQNIRDIRFENQLIFKNLKDSISEVAESGDYYVDFINGVVYSHDEADGYMSYTYRDFPFDLVWQPVRAYPYNDSDLDLRHKDLLIDEDGVERNLLLNHEGAMIANQVLRIHPLGWGE